MGYGDPVEPGTVLTLPEDTEHVSRKQFTVVGTVQDPQHFSTDKESSTAGDGQLDDIVFLPEGSLTTDYYTACYLKVKMPACMIITRTSIRRQWMTQPQG